MKWGDIEILFFVRKIVHGHQGMSFKESLQVLLNIWNGMLLNWPYSQLTDIKALTHDVSSVYVLIYTWHLTCALTLLKYVVIVKSTQLPKGPFFNKSEATTSGQNVYHHLNGPLCIIDVLIPCFHINMAFLPLFLWVYNCFTWYEKILLTRSIFRQCLGLLVWCLPSRSASIFLKWLYMLFM